MIKELVKKYGKDKINTLTKYPSILTLHKLGEKGRLTNELTTPISLDDELFATEKIDGTNARIICYGDEYLVGAREFILHHSNDLYHDNAQGIVDGLKSLNITPPETDKLTVIYGEFYGGRTSANSKWYGKDKVGFRVFDVAVYDDLSTILNMTQKEISYWRESEWKDGIKYGQNFLTRSDIMINLYPNFELVPSVEFQISDFSHESILEALNTHIPRTNVALSEDATNKSEGVVIRTKDRSKIVKLRFEDYEKTLRLTYK